MTRALRLLIKLTMMLLVLPITSALAQTYPSRPITLIVPFSPGTGADVAGRMVAGELAKRWQVAVPVENKVGANGIIGAGYVANAAPDGYTLLSTASTHLVNAALRKNLPYDTVKDFKPIVRFSDTMLVLVVSKDSPVNSLQELIAYAKARPGELNYASGGNGSALHLAGALLNSMAGTNIIHVPYKGGSQALTDTIAGRVFMSFTAVATAASQVKGGKLKAIGVSGLKRSKSMPDVPTLDEAGLRGFEVVAWSGLLAPANTPDPICRKISDAVVEIASSPAFAENMIKQGVEVNVVGIDAFPALFAAEAVRWAKIVAISGAVVD